MANEKQMSTQVLWIRGHGQIHGPLQQDPGANNHIPWKGTTPELSHVSKRHPDLGGLDNLAWEWEDQTIDTLTWEWEDQTP